ncbi:ribonuclease activity regulator RraA [Paramicrobacterium agarici]|uniref:ribonuclease activity regulator RraA n=1 Tax=Paramicrobacterium agarici TaxID=630514 RepID=UPI0011546DD2|nr:ribonuclease activity regulator RraA [Microbacterium agarici]TQO22298.1 regulator of RNase E activity RraA [Microbacterium agarici]
MSTATDSQAQTAPLSREVLAALNVVSTATLTTRLMDLGLRNTFLHQLTAANPHRNRLVGEAFTMRCIPSREDVDVLSVFNDYDHPQRRAIESLTPGSVLVVDARRLTRSASLGHILATRAKARGAAGIVTDGSVRDMVGFERLDLPTFTAGASPTTNLTLHHVVDMQVPIGCAEVAVYPGDVMVGDRDGVICIPRHLVEQVATAAVEQERLEEYILELVESGKPLRGVYPPDENTMADYRSRQSEAVRDA